VDVPPVLRRAATQPSAPRRIGIATVAVHSDADKDAPHVDMADEAVRMQGWLAAASALSLALATFACGRLTRLFGDRTYLAMAGRTMAGLVLALFAAALKRRIET
jgi:MFS family permease